MPELLFVSPRFLFPADEGGKIRTTQVLRGMKGGPFRIHLACPEPDARERAFEGELPSVCDTHSYWKRPASGPLHRLLRLRRLSHDLPVPVLDDDSRSARRLIQDELARKPDLIVFDFVHSSVLAPSDLPVPSLLFTHNVEAEIFERHANEARSSWKRRIFASQAEKMRRFEGDCCRRHDHIVAVSERDAEQFRERYGRREVSVIPTGVDLEYFSYAEPGTSLEVVFGWRPRLATRMRTASPGCSTRFGTWSRRRSRKRVYESLGATRIIPFGIGPAVEELNSWASSMTSGRKSGDAVPTQSRSAWAEARA